MGIEERFWAKVSPEPNSGCWLWTGAVTGGGYGRFNVGYSESAHRISYEMHVGPIPDGLDLDHLCRVRCCVNPDHLEPVTRSENCKRGETVKHLTEMMRSKTHCPQGHPYSGSNVFVVAGSRRCRECTRGQMKLRGKYYARRYRERKRHCLSGTI